MDDRAGTSMVMAVTAAASASAAHSRLGSNPKAANRQEVERKIDEIDQTLKTQSKPDSMAVVPPPQPNPLPVPAAPVAATRTDLAAVPSAAEPPPISPDKIVLPNDASLTIHHGEGLLQATAKALAADGTILGTGTGQQNVTRDKTVNLDIVFAPGSGGIDAGVGGDGGSSDGGESEVGPFDAGADRAGSDAVQADARPEDAPVDGAIIPVDAATGMDAIDAPKVGDTLGTGGASGSDGSATGGNTSTGGISGTGGAVVGGAPAPDAAVVADVASTGGVGGGGTTVVGGTTAVGGSTVTGGSTATGGSSSVPAPHVVELASSDNATCARKSDGTVWCWGQAFHPSETSDPVDYVTGMLGPVSVDTAPPTQIPGVTCVLLNSGKVMCWGKNDYSQLGTGTLESSVAPVEVPGISTARAIVVGAKHSCALLADKTVRCWGRNNLGTLGDGNGGSGASPSATPVQVLDITTAKAIASGASHTCALLENGTAMCWGLGNFGRLGDGTTVTKLSPVPVVLNLAGDPLSGVASLDLGGTTTCALKTDRSVYRSIAGAGACGPPTAIRPRSTVSTRC